MASEYEYRTESLPSLRDSKRLSKMITRMGKRGWEMVDKQEGGLIFGRARVTFRRPKPGADMSPVGTVVSASGDRAAEDLARLDVMLADGQIDGPEYLRRKQLFGLQ